MPDWVALSLLLEHWSPPAGMAGLRPWPVDGCRRRRVLASIGLRPVGHYAAPAVARPSLVPARPVAGAAGHPTADRRPGRCKALMRPVGANSGWGWFRRSAFGPCSGPAPFLLRCRSISRSRQDETAQSDEAVGQPSTIRWKRSRSLLIPYRLRRGLCWWPLHPVRSLCLVAGHFSTTTTRRAEDKPHLADAHRAEPRRRSPTATASSCAELLGIHAGDHPSQTGNLEETINALAEIVDIQPKDRKRFRACSKKQEFRVHAHPTR